MNGRRSHELEVEPGRIVRRFTEDESLQLAERWIGVYARDALGANIKAYLWHTFSSGSYPSVCKSEAHDRYLRQAVTEVVALSNDRRSAWLIADALPIRCNFTDFCVFPLNLAWTMAFTHEDGWLGPYFATHPDYRALVAQDIEQHRARQRKARELERARREGWV
ncbi:MAG: DUF4275 family protein [Candidatus Accumulibacter sp.]|jgi:hypothetical protein|nr:DUF4275 family protein [Accumulibacter sp.]